MTLVDLFGVNGKLTVGQECLRAAVVFVYGLILVRCAGRRVFGKWAALDIVVSIVVGSNLSRALTGSAPFAGTLVATALLMALHWLLAQVAARSRVVSELVEGAPIELARAGAPLPGLLRRQSISEHDLGEALRQSGVEQVEEARLMVLEPSGKITVLKQ